MAQQSAAPRRPCGGAYPAERWRNSPSMPLTIWSTDWSAARRVSMVRTAYMTVE